MRYLDQKEEVLVFKLTPYGRKLFSSGEFEPVYYAFLDDTVAYDSLYTFQNEAQNDADLRIREYPTTEPQIAFDGLESSFSRRTNFQNNYDQSFAISNTLGNADLGSQYVPSFEVKYYKSELDDVVSYVSGAYCNIPIPQLYSNLEYYIKTENSSSAKYVVSDFNSKLFDDGTYFIVEPDEILVGVNEKNTSFLSENFDIEVYRVESYYVGGNAKENLIPLKFAKKKQQVLTENLELKDVEEDYQEIVLTPENVEFYFDIFTDNEISAEEMCKIKDVQFNYFLNTKKSCLDKSVVEGDIYSNLPEDDYEDPC